MNRFCMSSIAAVLLVATCLSTGLFAQDIAEQAQTQDDVAQEYDPADEQTLQQKVSKILAYRFFSTMKREGAEIDLEHFIAGAKLALESKELGISEEDSEIAMGQFEQLMVRRAMEKRKLLADDNLAEGEKYAEEFKAKEGVVTLESGVQYRVLKAGEGASPTITDRVTVNYTGKLLNGEVFDSTKGGEPATFAVGGLIRGMTEALQKMKVGDTIEVLIPGSSAYGETGSKGPNGTAKNGFSDWPQRDAHFRIGIAGNHQ